MQNSALKNFRIISFIEGVSYLILLFIAMPAKHAFDFPILVKIVGMMHGILFILFVYFLMNVTSKLSWKISKALIFFLTSLIPFGMFYIEKKAKESVQTA